ncbi:MAG: hypothetical protein M1840_004526 [Geoglossum simile]|nr:MAG: hypothetical protein M1840_004526 [Geoglossum simile]
MRKDKGKGKEKAPSSPPRPYLPASYEIPERTSSRAPLHTQQKIELLRRSHIDLKRKASELSQSSEHSNPGDFLQVRQEQVRNQEQQHKVLFEGFRESFANGELEKKYFQALAYDCWRKRARLTNEDKDTTSDYSVAYAELLTNLWKTHESPAGWEARTPHEHNEWKAGLRYSYNAYDPEDRENLWCPVLKAYGRAAYRTAAPIVPYSIGYTNAGYLFGDPSRGAEFLWSMGNALVMDRALEKQFGRGDFVLVPIPTERGEPSRWRFILMNENLRTHKLGLVSCTSYEKYGDLDGTELEFKNDNRPAHRFLYYHFVSTLLRYARYEKPGWAEKRVNLPTGKIWATPGPYLRKSMLKALANAIGDYEPPAELFGSGVFDGKGSKSPQEEKLIAREILVEREQCIGGEKFELPVDI